MPTALAAILPAMETGTSVRLDIATQPRWDGLPSPSIKAARGFTRKLVEAYWDKATQGKLRGICDPTQFGLSTSNLSCPRAYSGIAEQLAADLATRDYIEAAFQIGQIFTSILPATYRAQHGIYFTPPALTNRLLDICESHGIDWSTDSVLDPACGGGAFLAPVVARKCQSLKGRTAAAVFDAISTTVRGYELDPFSAWLSQVFADIAALEICVRVGRRLPRIVEVRNSLDPLDRTAPTFDLVIGNPPYSRIKLDPGQRAQYARSLYGHANLYGLFTDQALRLCVPEGVIAYVTPTGFLGGEYFKRLRALLRTEAHPLHVEFISDREGVFDNVLQETLLATYRKGKPNGSVAVGVLQTDGHQILSRRSLGRCALSLNVEDPWLLPRNASQSSLMRQAARLPHRLADYGFGVSTGPLVWNRHKAQLQHATGKDVYPLIWAESVTAAGEFHFRAERRNHAPYFRANLPRDSWLLVTQPCALLQRTTSKEQDRRLILATMPADFIKKHGAVVVENHLNMLRTVVDQPVFPLEVLVAVLNSRFADDMFRCINGSVAVSAYELEALPLPGPSCLRQVERLLRRRVGKEVIERAIEKGYLNADDADAA